MACLPGVNRGFFFVFAWQLISTLRYPLILAFPFAPIAVLEIQLVFLFDS